MPNFYRIAAPLNKKLLKDPPFTFGDLTETEVQAMRTLQEKLISPPFLTLLKRTGKYIVDTDGCEKQVGCVLLEG